MGLLIEKGTHESLKIELLAHYLKDIIQLQLNNNKEDKYSLVSHGQTSIHTL